MKMYSTLLALTLIISGQVFAGDNNAQGRVNRLLRFIANQSSNRDTALYTLIAKRCNRYLPFSEEHNCRSAVKKQIELLDYDIIYNDKKQYPPKETWSRESFVFIAFKKKLIDILSDPDTSIYLDKMRLGLSDYLTGANPQFNIWDMTLAYYNSPLLAARTIAALFQDTSTVKLHLAYLERVRPQGRMAFDSNLERLSKVIDSINLILDYSEDNFRSLFYPSPFREHLKKNIYHFYVPLYLSMAMAAGGMDLEHALMAPMMLTITYEFITLAPDYSYLLRDPERLDPVQTASTLRDIFAGYCGANFGIGKNISPDFFVQMRESFAKSTADGVELLLHSAN